MNSAVASPQRVSVEEHLATEEHSDVRLHLAWNRGDYDYYPAILVTCDPSDDHPRFVRPPTLLVEVFSESTRRIDQREKFFAYRAVESLQDYVMMKSDRVEVTVFRRTEEWSAEVLQGEETVLPLPALKLDLPLLQICTGS